MDKSIRVLIVDDEELARIGLRLMLEKFSLVEIVGEAHNIISATEAINLLKPDAIFLDIEFPGESGFDLLNNIDEHVKIVFVTAFDEFAIRAFEVNACDYLLKPINVKRLEQSIKRLEGIAVNPQSSNAVFNYDDQIFISVNYKFYFIKINSIVRISSGGKYSEILTTGKIKGLVKKSLLEWEDSLPKKQFIRIHRSTIINIDFVDKVVKESNSSYIVFLKCTAEKHYISRRFAHKLKDKIII